MGIVIIELIQGDSVAARKALRHLLEINGQAFDSEMCAAQGLIRSYEAGEDEELQQVLKSGVIRAMDNAYLRIIRNLSAPGKVTTGNGENDDEEDLR